jgi:hypothetical protein
MRCFLALSLFQVCLDKIADVGISGCLQEIAQVHHILVQFGFKPQGNRSSIGIDPGSSPLHGDLLIILSVFVLVIGHRKLLDA